MLIVAGSVVATVAGRLEIPLIIPRKATESVKYDAFTATSQGISSAIALSAAVVTARSLETAR
jgi:6,7-dimethyl-8-ribityllumazine synthase